MSGQPPRGPRSRGGGFPGRGGNQNRGGYQNQAPDSGSSSRGGRGGRGNRGNIPYRDNRGTKPFSNEPKTFTSSIGPPLPPDTTVNKLENDFFTTKATSHPDISPIRPGYGVNGTEVILWANYFTFRISDTKLYQYNWTIAPTPRSKRERTQIIRLLIESLDPRTETVTDFNSILISRSEIEQLEIEVTYRDEGEDVPSTDARQYIVNLTFAKTLDVADVLRYLSSTDRSLQTEHQSGVVHALNVLINHYPKASNTITTVGASKSFSLTGADTVSLEGGLKTMRGFFTSIRAATGRILLNVNVSHAAFYEVKRLDDTMRAYRAKNPNGNLEHFLTKLKVKTTHLKRKANRNGEEIIRPKTIFGFATPSDGRAHGDYKGLTHPPKVNKHKAGPKDVFFWLDEISKPDKYISVYEFFKKKHNITIKDPDVPVVNVGNRDHPSYLPAEVCHILDGQYFKPKLQPYQTDNMINFAVRAPGQNAKSIEGQSLATLGLAGDVFPQLRSFGASVSPSLITIKGRLLAEPSLEYRGNVSVTVNGGSWNMLHHGNKLKFSSSTALNVWACLVIRMPDLYPIDKLNAERLVALMNTFKQVLTETGINVTRGPNQRMIPLSGTYDFADTTNLSTSPIEDFIKEAAHNKAQLLIIILPKAQIPIYNYIKQLADVKYGLRTICSVASKIEQAGDQYLRNLALKVNLKLGGVNLVLKTPSPGRVIGDSTTMVVGIDVTHPSPGSAPNAPSVAAMVASIDSRLNQWPGVLRVQPKRRMEMVWDLCEMLKSRLNLWRQKSGRQAYPDNILIYRDGVSESQYDAVLEQELPRLQKACKELYTPLEQKKGLPRMTIVIVGKRHHTRFYVTNDKDADKSGNPKAGTVVDRGITEVRNWDFYLQSHSAIKGTARPAHYFVVFDQIFCNKDTKAEKAADELQAITQKLCYVFGRATKAVSYCTPAYYADILCERARCYLSDLYDPPKDRRPPPRAGTIPDELSQEELTRLTPRLTVHANLKDSMFYI